MEWIEVTGKTLDDAKELALDRLGVSDADLEYEVLEEARGGFLGMGRSEARIRARVRPVSREKPDDRRGRRRRPRGDERGARPAERRPEAGAAPAATAGTRPRQRRGGRGRHRAEGAGQTSAEHPAAPAAAPEGATMVDEIPLDEQREVAEEFLRELVRRFGITATVTSREDEGRLEISITGEQLGILIGRDAATLDALEELTQAVVQTRCDGHASRIRVDVAGYRQRRRDALVAFTRQLADEVRASGEPRRLEPMGSLDRKVVHDVIAEMDDLETTSEGMEPRRRVVIRPAS
jgi:spoIIIJ-associated protein